VFIVIYELEDITPRYHLLQHGMFGCCLPYLKIRDVVIIKDNNFNPLSFPLSVVRRVFRPRFIANSLEKEKSVKKTITTANHF